MGLLLLDISPAEHLWFAASDSMPAVLGAVVSLLRSFSPAEHLPGALVMYTSLEPPPATAINCASVASTGTLGDSSQLRDVKLGSLG